MDSPILLMVTNVDALAEEIQNILELMQYENVCYRTNDQNLFRSVEEVKPDLVLFDLDTSVDPDILQTAEKLRSRHKVPILFIMNETDIRMMNTAWEAEPYGYLFKPLRSAIVIAEIDMALHRYTLEKKLEKSQEMFRILFLNMAEGVAIHRMIYDRNEKAVNYEIVEINPRFENILGIPRENAVGKLATAVYKVPDPPFIGEYSVVEKTGLTAHLEVYFPPMGKYFSVSVVKMETGYFATIFYDITERVHNQIELYENEKKMRTLFKEAPAYIVEVGKDLRVITMNRAPPNWRTEEIIGMKITEFIPPAERNKVEKVLSDVFEKNTVLTYEGTLARSRSGKPFEIVSRIAPVTNGSEVLSALIVFWDVTSK